MLLTRVSVDDVVSGVGDVSVVAVVTVGDSGGCGDGGDDVREICVQKCVWWTI
jgi:hypothetical protein